MLKLLVSAEFAAWFASLDDATAEDAATCLDIIEQLGPDRSAPGSRESLLWYEHPIAARFSQTHPIAWELEAWGEFRDYVHNVLERLQAPRFTKRVMRLEPAKAAAVIDAIKRIKRTADPRASWALALRSKTRTNVNDSCAEVRELYFEALTAAGFAVSDVPAHSLALRELAHRVRAPGFRILYGVDVAKETALIAVGERLDRTFYGEAVRLAERMWKDFTLGTLRVEERSER